MNDSGNYPPAVVIDVGTGTTKAGISGLDCPTSVFPSVVGRFQEGKAVTAVDQKSLFVGEEAVERSDVLNIQSPVEHGIVKNWDDIEAIWHHTFDKELKVNPEEQPAFLSEPPLNQRADRERITETMFEIFNVPAFYMTQHPVLILYSSGRCSGIVLDLGESSSCSSPIYEGYVLPHAVIRSEVGGRDVDDYLMKMLVERGYSFLDRKCIRDIKETFCYISENFEKEKDIVPDESEKIFKLPDETEISVKSERFKCPEIFFQPQLIGQDDAGCSDILYQSIMKCDTDIRKQLYHDIVLSGGSSMYDGFVTRFKKEITSLCSTNMEINVVRSKHTEPKYAVWDGASIVSSLSTFEMGWITKRDYDEVGPAMIHRKCY